MCRFRSRRVVLFFTLISVFSGMVTLIYQYGRLVSVLENRLQNDMRPVYKRRLTGKSSVLYPEIHEEITLGNDDSEERLTQHKQVQFVSEMNTTKFVWPWPETNDTIEACKTEDFHQLGDLPAISIVITFHDGEALSTILHTVYSIIQRTPASLLREIILIDDNTKKDEFRTDLPKFLATDEFGSKVFIQRSNVSLGLIRARLRGFRLAQAAVVVSMDSHMEVQPNWLEPLLYEIKRNKRTLAASFLDWIELKDGVWEYTYGGTNWKTVFDWGFVFSAQTISQHDMDQRKITDPIMSPVTMGTIFAINKAFFEEIGSFDAGMEKWGGENLDLPIRVWLAGGRVVNVPCSRAAHLEYKGNRDYRNGWSRIIQKNYKRFAAVWLDGYQDIFYRYYPKLKTVDVGDLSERMALKKKWSRDFAWFLRNVYPELGIPERDGFSWGGVKNMGIGQCLDTWYKPFPRVADCAGPTDRQGFYWSLKQELRMPIHEYVPRLSSTEKLIRTDYTRKFNSTPTVEWMHWKKGPLYETITGLCLEATNTYQVLLNDCDMRNPNQKWTFKFYTENYKRMLRHNDSDYNQLRRMMMEFRLRHHVDYN